MEGMNTNIMDINRILDEARNLGCSDLHFTAGLPPVVRLHGSIRKLSGYPDCTEHCRGKADRAQLDNGCIGYAAPTGCEPAQPRA